MEMGNHGNWGSSSKAINIDDQMERRDDDNDDDDNTGIGRTYECSYCKRGFTNAQALGGHMNIHRKDKAKVKHPTFSSSFSSSSAPYMPKEASTYFSTNVAPHWNHQAYYNPIANPRSSQPSIYYGNNDLPIGRSSLFGTYEEHLGTDLSLRVNSSRATHQEGEVKNKENNFDSIDLELRLGYDP